MADKALIQGAAAVAAGKAAKGMAFREGFAAGAGDFAQKLAKGVEIREQKIADGSALAKANFMTWDTNGLPPKYAELIQKEMAAANEKLNETGKDIKISGAAQKSIMDKIVQDASNKAKGYIQNIELEREVGSLNMQLEDPQIAQTISGLVDPDIHDKITKVGGGKYTLDNNNNYIFEGDEKAYSFQEVQEMVQKFKNSTYDRTQVGEFRGDNLKIAAQSKDQKDFEKNIDNLMKSSYMLTDPKDVFQIKSQLVNVYGNEPALLEGLSPQQLYDKLKETRIEYGKSQVPKPVLTPSPGVDAFKAITNLTNRYITEERLAGENSVLLRKKIDDKEVRKVTDLGDGKFEIKLEERLGRDSEGNTIIDTTTLNLDILNKDDRKKIDDAFAADNYSGKALGDYKNFYLQNIDNIEMPERKKLESTGTSTPTTTSLPEYFSEFNSDVPTQLKNEDGEVIKSKSKEDNYVRNVLNVKGSRSMGSAGFKVANMVRRDYNGVFSEANIRKAAYELNYKGTDANGRSFGKSAIEESELASTTKKEKVNLLLETTNTTPATELTSTERDNLTDKDRKDLKDFGIVTQIAGITKKDLAVLDYMREAGFKTKLEYEQALAAQFE